MRMVIHFDFITIAGGVFQHRLLCQGVRRGLVEALQCWMVCLEAWGAILVIQFGVFETCYTFLYVIKCLFSVAHSNLWFGAGEWRCEQPNRGSGQTSCVLG